MKSNPSLKTTVAQVIADRFIAELNKGVAPWTRGFHVIAPRNASSLKPYRGINYFLLSMLGIDYAMTFNQAKAMGGNVKKGAKGIPVAFWNIKKETAADGTETKRAFMRYYTVFNYTDTEGTSFTPPAVSKGNAVQVETAESVFSKAQALAGFTVSVGGNQPCFIPAMNVIQMPNMDRWESSARYYKTLFHELGHALGKVTGKVFSSGGEGYATEELVAELFAASMLGTLGIDCAGAWENSVAYVQGWAKRLTDEPQAIISAAQEAQKRLDLIFPKAGSAEIEEPESAESAETAVA